MRQLLQACAKAHKALWHASWALACGIVLAWASAAPVQAQAGCTQGVCVSAGPRLVSVDSTQSPLLNLLFRSLLPGTTVNLTTLDWNGLAAADINLNALIAQLGTNLSLDPSQVLDANITLGQLQLAMVQVLQADGNTAAVNALNLLPLNVPALTGTIQLSDLLQIALPSGSLADIDLDVLDLVTGMVQLYNYTNILTTPPPVSVDTAALGLPGVANMQMWLQVVEPPTYVCGPVGASFHSAAIRIKLNTDLLQGLNLTALTNALNGLNIGGVLSVSNAAVSASVLKLQLYADVARAEGTISAIDLVNSVVTLNARAGLVNVYVGTIADAVFFNRTQVITPAMVTPMVLTDLSVGLRVSTLLGIPIADVQVPIAVQVRAVASGTPSLQTLVFNGPFPETQTLSCGTSCAGDLVNSLLTSLDVTMVSGNPTVVLLGALPLPLPIATIVNAVTGTLEAQLDTMVPQIVTPVLQSLLGLVDNLLELLGIAIGQAVFTVEGIAQSCAAVLSLEKILQPAGDPGLFNLSISQGATVLASATDVGNGGATAPVVTTPGDSYDLAETAGTGTTLAPYVSTWECTDQNSTVVSSGSGTSFALTAPALGPTPVTITCRITNRTRQADLSITKSDGSPTYTPGGSATYVLTVSNAGPDAVVGATVSDTLPNGATLSGPWTCSATAGSSCSAASGGSAGDQSISLSVDLAAPDGVATINVPVTFSADPGAY